MRSTTSLARWVLLIHQIPAKPDYFRVKIWRRLQTLGAVAIKNSVYALPNTEQGHEDFQWTVREILAGGGEAMVCNAELIEGLSDEQVEKMFRTARDADYKEIMQWFSTSKITPEKVFITHGEASAADEFRRRLSESFGWNCEVPTQNQTARLES